MGKWLERVKQLDDSPVDVDYFISRACEGLPVSVDWVKKEVLDDFDLDDIANRKFPKECLIAHIKYQMTKHKIVEMRKR
ncbi:hypothetical protein N9I26_02460 [Pseudomonadales bacterium]|nr:hypothetical protein [Pseudomonadales bacterium]